MSEFSSDYESDGKCDFISPSSFNRCELPAHSKHVPTELVYCRAHVQHYTKPHPFQVEQKWEFISTEEKQ